MTAPNDFELLELATPYALDAVTDWERAEVDRRLAAAPAPVAASFGEEVRAVRETMAVVSAATAAEPPPQLRAAILTLTEPVNLQTRRQSNRRTAALASAAVAPSTTATLHDLGASKALAFTVEPGTGSTQPTGTVLAELPLT